MIIGHLKKGFNLFGNQKGKMLKVREQKLAPCLATGTFFTLPYHCVPVETQL